MAVKMIWMGESQHSKTEGACLLAQACTFFLLYKHIHQFIHRKSAYAVVVLE